MVTEEDDSSRLDNYNDGDMSDDYYSDIHNPCSGDLWPSRHNFRDIELKSCM